MEILRATNLENVVHYVQSLQQPTESAQLKNT